MNGCNYRTPLLTCLVLLCQVASGQYILNGSAQKVSCNCYTLTEETINQGGSVWNSKKIDLTKSFDFRFSVYLGCNDSAGADGIVFMLQPNNTSIGNNGGGMGFSGVRPSIGIALDTWQNDIWNDPAFDHISIQANGNVDHRNDLAGPVPASANSMNIEDCNWHVLRIVWNADTRKLQAYFDDALRVERQIDLVNTIFNGDPEVFWGFSGSTGGYTNVQRFCTALNPLIQANITGSNGCVGSAVKFTETSESFAPIVSYNWSFGDGTTSTEKIPPPHTYSAAGNYPVSLKITGLDGCEKDTTFIITINSLPNVELTVFDTCSGFVPRYQLQDTNIGVSYQWRLDGSLISTSQQPQLPPASVGTHQLQLVVASDFGCGTPATVTRNFTIKPLPVVDALVTDGCARETIQLQGIQRDSRTNITQWQWRFGDGTGAAMQNTSHRYENAGNYVVNLQANASNGCQSETVAKTVGIKSAAVAFAGLDTSVIQGVPFQLRGQGNGTLRWSPAGGLSDPASPNPIVTLVNDQQFILTVTTEEGCTATDAVLVRTFNGPAIYVPTAFTPNGDGKNEVLRPVYVGIKELKQFVVFNRWGQQLFSTKDMGRGWEGRTATSGTYVWLVQAVDANGRLVTLKGTVTVIR